MDANQTGRLVNVIFRAIALAMGVAVVVLNILKTAAVETQTLLLGIGLFALAVTLVDKK